MKLRMRALLRQIALFVFGISLLLRMLIPAGYMPAAFGNGWPITLCEHGMPSGMFAVQHHHHGDAAEPDAVPLDSCAFGASAAVYAPASEFHIALALAARITATPAAVSRTATATAVPFRSRAPPVISSFV